MKSSDITRHLKAFKDRVVKIDRGGPNSRVGKIMEVHKDYITLLTREDGVLYYNADHIKSVTDNVKDGMGEDNFEEVGGELESKNASDKPADFKSLLTSLKYKWVQINRGGPAKVEGVVNDISDDAITLIRDNEIIIIIIFHINNISVGKKPKKDEDDHKKDDSKKDDHKKDDSKKDDHKKDDSKKDDCKKDDNRKRRS